MTITFQRCLFLLLLCLPALGSANGSGPANGTQTLLALLLDAPQLNAYFHVDVRPARTPLCMLKGDWYRPDIGLMKFGQPVQFVDSAKSQTTCFVIRKIESKTTTATIQFRYAPEGIEGEAVFGKNQQGWQVKSIFIHEQ